MAFSAPSGETWNYTPLVKVHGGDGAAPEPDQHELRVDPCPPPAILPRAAAPLPLAVRSRLGGAVTTAAESLPRPSTDSQALTSRPLSGNAQPFSIARSAEADAGFSTLRVPSLTPPHARTARAWVQMGQSDRLPRMGQEEPAEFRPPPRNSCRAPPGPAARDRPTTSPSASLGTTGAGPRLCAPARWTTHHPAPCRPGPARRSRSALRQPTAGQASSFPARRRCARRRAGSCAGSPTRSRTRRAPSPSRATRRTPSSPPARRASRALPPRLATRDPRSRRGFPRTERGDLVRSRSETLTQPKLRKTLSSSTRAAGRPADSEGSTSATSRGRHKGWRRLWDSSGNWCSMWSQGDADTATDSGIDRSPQDHSPQAAQSWVSGGEWQPAL